MPNPTDPTQINKDILIKIPPSSIFSINLQTTTTTTTYSPNVANPSSSLLKDEGQYRQFLLTANNVLPIPALSGDRCCLPGIR